ncbi:hypothetical protein [Aureimonas glaciei]|uniref:hypothetical protein n=1 Tax=Aureimonas glaciei TaxID=1776957 RepID=UPI00166ED78F|nr:hypothetical protein [Aureimonas glaciei]
MIASLLRRYRWFFRIGLAAILFAALKCLAGPGTGGGRDASRGRRFLPTFRRPAFPIESPT